MLVSSFLATVNVVQHNKPLLPQAQPQTHFGITTHSKPKLQVGNGGTITIDSEGTIKVKDDIVGRVAPKFRNEVLKQSNFFHTAKAGLWGVFTGDKTSDGQAIDHALHPGSKVIKGGNLILDLFGTPFKQDKPIVHQSIPEIDADIKNLVGSSVGGIYPVGGKSSKTGTYKSALQGFQIVLPDGKKVAASLLEINLYQMKQAGVKQAQVNVTPETAPLFEAILTDNPLLKGMNIVFNKSAAAGRGDLSHTGKKALGNLLRLFGDKTVANIGYPDAYYPQQEQSLWNAMKKMAGGKVDGVLMAEKIPAGDYQTATKYGIFKGNPNVHSVAEQKTSDQLEELFNAGQFPKEFLPANVGNNFFNSEAAKAISRIYKGPGRNDKTEHGLTKKEECFQQLGQAVTLHVSPKEEAFIDTGANSEELYSHLPMDGPHGTKLSGNAQPGTLYDVRGNAITMPKAESERHQEFRIRTKT